MAFFHELVHAAGKQINSLDSIFFYRQTDTSDQLASLMASHLQEFEPATDTMDITADTDAINGDDARKNITVHDNTYYDDKLDDGKMKMEKNRKLWLA